MFAKILVANRGEIAVRIMQTCREISIATVAVYSTADAAALHVAEADEAVQIGPPPAQQSYLNIEAILDAATKTGAEAVHPGYGFLAENASFAEAVTSAGLTWIGPPARVIALLGDKAASKELARTAGVPVVPGYHDDDPARIAAEAEQLGYPIMLKAVAGGGGKGMRAVISRSELAPALESARREALAAFGDDRILIEKLLPNPRHVEVQIVVDNSGYGVYLGERDCSLQRRHQKVVEESPSPVMTESLRTAMGEAALRLAHAAGCVNAGTVEFLFSGDSFYFLEVNTRIQVEHPVTEMLTGIDLVRVQIEIAAGLPLGLSQLDVQPRGHAIEARIYAENPAAGFVPATGRIESFEPANGPGTRNDVGVYPGVDVTQYYDPLLAKLIVHAHDRPQAVSRLRRALHDYRISGPITNLEFLAWLAHQDWFTVGRVSTGTLEEYWPPALSETAPRDVLLAASAFQLTSPAISAGGPWSESSSWRQGGVGASFAWELDGAVEAVRADRLAPNEWEIDARGLKSCIRLERTSRDSLLILEGDRVITARGATGNGGLAIELAGRRYELRPPPLEGSTGTGQQSDRDTGLSAPMPGTVVKVAVAPGQRVTAHEPLVVLEAMKMEHVVEAPYAAIVQAVLVEAGDVVTAGAPLVRLERE